MTNFHFGFTAINFLDFLRCKGKHYLRRLPTVSVIIPFYDEHATTIMRSVHSIINRTPPHLLREIILVNDASPKKDLYNDLRYHFRKQAWGAKVKIFMMAERSGPNWSRLAGARSASGDVLLFLDCLVEVGYNYLPPLLEPIVHNPRAVVTPTLDIINKRTYSIRPLGIGRTVFDWNFHAQRIPFHTAHEVSDTFKTPIMYGAAFAISARFFWELEPDSGLKIYGGDQFEMSFKTNLCGGVLYETPCSRIAHLYRRFHYKKHEHRIDYKAR
jgi:polypeptide N-acetylgalactosaminyltransferase